MTAQPIDEVTTRGIWAARYDWLRNYKTGTRFIVRYDDGRTVALDVTVLKEGGK